MKIGESSSDIEDLISQTSQDTEISIGYIKQRIGLLTSCFLSAPGFFLAKYSAAFPLSYHRITMAGLPDI